MEKEKQRRIKSIKISNKKKVLWISWYYEVLKNYLPYIKYLKESYEIYVIASSLPYGNDQQRSQKLLKENNIQGQVWKSDNPVDKILSSESKKATSLNSFLSYIPLLWKEKKKAQRFFSEIKPQIIITVSDRRQFEKYIIEEGHAHSVPSICFQWSLGPISKRTSIENKTGYLLEDIPQLRKNQLIKSLIRLPNSFLIRLLNLKTPALHAESFGGGNATILAVIGKGSKEFYSSMGVNPNKIKITGHALYEEIYSEFINNKYNLLKKKNDIYKSLNIPLNSQFIIYCTGAKKPRAYKYLSKEQAYLERKKKIKALLELSNDLYLIVKLHPREDITESLALAEVSPRIRVLQNIDINQILPLSSILLTRASTTAIYAMMFGLPVITYNYPPQPVGSLFDEIGGTIHVNNDEELTEVVSKILKKDESILKAIENRRNEFMIKHLNIDPKYDYKNENKTLPSLIKMENLIETLSI